MLSRFSANQPEVYDRRSEYPISYWGINFNRLGESSGKLPSPTLPSLIMQIENSIAYLNNVFGRPLHIPDAPVTQVHRIGLDAEPRYVESYKVARTLRDVKRDKNGMTEAQRTVLKAFRTHGSKHTARQLSTKVGYTKAYTTILLCDLFKQGYLKRHKERVALTKQYVYSLKD